MKIPSEQQAMSQIGERLAELTDINQGDVRRHNALDPDGVLQLGPLTFVIEWKNSGAAAPVTTAIEQLRTYTRNSNEAVIPLVVVPFMGEIGRQRCAEAEIAWLDLSGNARISASGLRIFIEGKPNRYKRRGRPSTAFAPKSSRIARWLLMHPDGAFTQREIVRATDMDEGYVSKVVARLDEDDLIIRNDSGAIQARDPDLLLDAWKEEYDFVKHDLIRGHVATRSGDVLLKQLANVLNRGSVSYAVTGLAAAWLLDRFAAFRIVTLYLAEQPTPDVLGELSFREETRGSNVWFVLPNDEGVFHGATSYDDIRCVHPVQVYLDLHAHPERAEEAAQKLRKDQLNWGSHG
jgi:hypothetical protein